MENLEHQEEFTRREEMLFRQARAGDEKAISTLVEIVKLMQLEWSNNQAVTPGYAETLADCFLAEFATSRIKKKIWEAKDNIVYYREEKVDWDGYDEYGQYYKNYSINRTGWTLMKYLMNVIRIRYSENNIIKLLGTWSK